MYKKYLLLCAAIFMLSACGFSDAANKDGQANLTGLGEKRGLIEAAGAFHQYQDYSVNFFNTIKGRQRFALFFHADWCPICKDFKSNVMDELSNGGLQNMVILEVDYDTETELKKQLGIIYQTTVVLFDESGQVQEKIIGASVADLKKFFES